MSSLPMGKNIFLSHKMHKPKVKTLKYSIVLKLTVRNHKENKEISHKLGETHLHYIR